MLFQDLRVKDIQTVFQFSSKVNCFSSQNRLSHILGIKLSGRALHTFEDHTEILEPNQLYFFNRNDPYTVEILEQGIAFSVHFTTYEPLAQKSFFTKVADPRAIIHVLERLEQSFLSSGTCAESLCEIYHLASLVSSINEAFPAEHNRRLAEAQTYMNLHFKEKSCIASAAALYGVTVRRFNDLFSSYCHTTPNRYLLQRKIEKAKQLLSAPDLTLAQIADLSGFSDVYYFSKVFKQETGLPPGEYRKDLY